MNEGTTTTVATESVPTEAIIDTKSLVQLSASTDVVAVVRAEAEAQKINGDEIANEISRVLTEVSVKDAQTIDQLKAIFDAALGVDEARASIIRTLEVYGGTADVSTAELLKGIAKELDDTSVVLGTLRDAIDGTKEAGRGLFSKAAGAIGGLFGKKDDSENENEGPVAQAHTLLGKKVLQLDATFVKEEVNLTKKRQLMNEKTPAVAKRIVILTGIVKVLDMKIAEMPETARERQAFTMVRDELVAARAEKVEKLYQLSELMNTQLQAEASIVATRSSTLSRLEGLVDVQNIAGGQERALKTRGLVSSKLDEMEGKNRNTISNILELIRQDRAASLARAQGAIDGIVWLANITRSHAEEMAKSEQLALGIRASIDTTVDSAQAAILENAKGAGNAGEEIRAIAAKLKADTDAIKASTPVPTTSLV